jgi:hypothetical protein
LRIEKKEAEVIEETEPTAEEQAATEAIAKQEKEEAAHKLELDNARLQGKVEALESSSKNVLRGNIETNQDQWKINALTDSNNLNDEEFQSKYKVSKLAAAQAIHEYEIKNISESNTRKFARIEADNKLLSKYPDLYENQKAIDEAINDASPEVRADSDRLAKAIERAYLAERKGNPAPKGQPVERKNISSGFEKPVPRNGGSGRVVENDEIPAEYAGVAKKFGLTSEKERQRLMASDDVETHYGNGIVFRDREKGFEQVA